MAEKTKARQLAEYMERSRMSPAKTMEEQTSEGIKGPRMMRGPAEIYDAVRSVVSPRKARTEEEMSELTREVSRGMKKGGPVQSKNWISGAIKKPGALRESMGVKGDKPIPAKKLAAAAKQPGKMGQRARLAQTLKGFKK